MLLLYASYKASLQRLIYRMSIAGQRQKYCVRIQSIGTARNLYTGLILELKNHFRADSDKKPSLHTLVTCRTLLVQQQCCY